MFEFFDALFDFVAGHPGGAVEAEAFAAERGDGAAVDDGAAEVLIEVAAGAGEVAEHGTDEGVAGAGGVNNTFEGVGRSDEESARAAQD